MVSESAYNKGITGERWAEIWYSKRGYLVQFPNVRKSGDLLAIHATTGEITKVEVKTAVENKDGFYRLCLYRKIKNGRVCTDYKHADELFIILVDRLGIIVGLFRLPVSEIHQKNLCITANSKKYEKYRVLMPQTWADSYYCC